MTNKDIKITVCDLDLTKVEPADKSNMTETSYDIRSVSNIIKSVTYISHGMTTICLIETTMSGYTVVGSSSCMNPDNYDKDAGIEAAKEDALSKLIDYEIYRMHVTQQIKINLKNTE